MEWTCDKSASKRFCLAFILSQQKAQKSLVLFAPKSATSNKYCGIAIAQLSNALAYTHTHTHHSYNNGTRALAECKRAWNEYRYLRYIWLNKELLTIGRVAFRHKI